MRLSERERGRESSFSHRCVSFYLWLSLFLPPCLSFFFSLSLSHLCLSFNFFSAALYPTVLVFLSFSLSLSPTMSLFLNFSLYGSLSPAPVSLSIVISLPPWPSFYLSLSSPYLFLYFFSLTLWFCLFLSFSTPVSLSTFLSLSLSHPCLFLFHHVSIFVILCGSLTKTAFSPTPVFQSFSLLSCLSLSPTYVCFSIFLSHLPCLSIVPLSLPPLFLFLSKESKIIIIKHRNFKWVEREREREREIEPHRERERTLTKR